MDNFRSGGDALFILLGGIMVLAMHSGFAFLELGTVRWKNQVNALVKILADFAVSTIAYFFIGYGIDVVLLRHDLRVRPGKDLRAIDVIAMEVGVDEIADGQRGDLAEIVEGGLCGRLAFRSIDHHYAAVRQYEDDVAQRVACGAIDVRVDADEFGRVLRELGGGR